MRKEKSPRDRCFRVMGLDSFILRNGYNDRKGNVIMEKKIATEELGCRGVRDRRDSSLVPLAMRVRYL